MRFDLNGQVVVLDREKAIDADKDIMEQNRIAPLSRFDSKGRTRFTLVGVTVGPTGIIARAMVSASDGEGTRRGRW